MKLKKILLLFAAAAITGGGCTMFKTVEYQTADGIALEKLDFDCNYDKNTRKIYLSGANGTFVMDLNRRISLFNGTKVWLFSPPKFDKENVLRIGVSDVQKIINPLLLKKYSLSRSVKRIVVDAGHGGHDNGAVGLKHKEKDLNLSLSLKIKSALENKGFEVIMTRAEDKFLTLDERSEFAKQQKADLFLCVHHNASGGTKKANGTETFSLSAAGMNSTQDRKGIIPAGTLPGNTFDDANINLNYQIQSHIINSIKTNDRGMKFARFRVLVNAPCPAILLEAGFVSNPDEEIASATEDRQTKIARAVTDAILQFTNQKEQHNE